MYFDLPDCNRCCLCVPLRHGIIVFGYLNLIFTILVISLEAWLDYGDSLASHAIMMYRGVGVYIQIWFPFILYTLEAIFNVVLLIGAHTKQARLMRVYYYYGIITTAATCLSFIVVRFENPYGEAFYFDSFEFALAFAGFVIQVYLLLLLRTELRKLKYQEGQFSYVNHMSEVVLEPPIFRDGSNPL